MSEKVTSGTVDRVSFDYGLEFLIGGFVLRVEGTARLYEGAVVEFDVEGAQSVAVPLVGLLHREVSVSIAADSTLEFRDFSGALVFEAPPSVECESWTVTAVDGQKLVCGLGGEISRFPTA